MKHRVVQEEPEDDEFEDESDEGSELEDDSDMEEDSDDEFTDMAGVLEGLLTTDEDNVCTAMLKIASQLETTNKLLVRVVSHLTKPAAPAPAPTPVEQE